MAPSSVLLIATRQIGDVLLTTPLLRSLRIAYPLANIDILVFENTGGILQGNPDLNQIISVPVKPTKREFFALIRRLFRKYDLTISTQGGDRPLLYSLFAGRKKRISILNGRRWQDGWKQWLLDDWILLDNVETHTVIQNLKLLDCLDLKPYFKVIPPSPDPDQYATFIQQLPFDCKQDPFVIIHPFPRFQYKDWQFDCWLEVIQHLLQQNKRVILSGGPADHEAEYCDNLVTQARSEQVISIAGQTSFAILAGLIAQAERYLGPDTAVSHLASALGIPVTVVLGPSNPMKWAPWPHSCLLQQGSPWVKKQALQISGNVTLVQGSGSCVPCFEEGCNRHKQSHSRCLDQLPAQAVIKLL